MHAFQLTRQHAQDPALLPLIIGRPGLPKSKRYLKFRPVRC